ncbi:unnamed protein product (macronuclear) [Paramecium tetraurelia]|uniref:Uncharacterized protein n=1 Tax=Paramecium tetraurelia TaxID=5888 RepID=A0EF50_PARTE|nr:uncharacterized protein GSPATT00026264001 [Paramecium tetraurelia]CAK93941.1 unnamed protein product [Paramecium tetraurelia]|eukprot:XP_001461314.1 hypothetical protein (macronuclear) [Paramecium tetraurelia strain d4-2]
MKSSLINSQSLPQLQQRMIHSKILDDKVPKPCKYPLFEQPQFKYKSEKNNTKSPLRLNPAIKSTYSKFKASIVKSYNNQLFDQYQMTKTQRRIQNEIEIKKQWRQQKYLEEKAKIQYLNVEEKDIDLNKELLNQLKLNLFCE